MSANLRLLKGVVDASTIAAASNWLQDLAVEFGFGHEDTYRIDLCASELVTNIASYAEPAYHGMLLELQAAIGEQRLALTVIDAAQAFDPLSVAPPAAATSIEEMKVGGQGIHLVRQFSDAARYERSADMNRIELVFDLAAPTQSPNKQNLIPRGVDRRRADGAAARRAASPGGETLQDRRRSDDRRAKDYLSWAHIFRNVPITALEGLVDRLPIASYVANFVVLKPGDMNSEVLVVLDGVLKIYLDQPGSGEFIEIGAGGCVGEMSVIDGQPASAYVVAGERTKVLVVDADTFLSEVMAIPGVSRNLMSALSERMRRGNEQIIQRVRAQMEMERVQRELQYARSIQESLLPREPLFADESRLQCAARMITAREVGGDFYDIFALDSRHVFFVVADVCGKGLPAALFMVRAIAALRAQSGGDGRPTEYTEEIISRLNRQLCVYNDAQQFLTAFSGILDLDTRTLHYVNAGHNAPLLALGDASFAYISDPINPIVGMIDDLPYRAGTIELPQGSTLLLYTDGVTEAENHDGGMLGEERLIARLNSIASRESGELVDAVFAEVMEFVGDAPQSDDITVLAIRLA